MVAEEISKTVSGTQSVPQHNMFLTEGEKPPLNWHSYNYNFIRSY